MADPWPIPKPIGAPQPVNVGEGITYVNPQSRKGTGYGLIVLVENSAAGFTVKDGVPSASMKWAEEGYCVVEVTPKAFGNGSQDPIRTATKQLNESPKIESKGVYGLVCYSPAVWDLASPFLAQHKDTIVAAVLYNDVTSHSKLTSLPIPTLQHLAGKLDKKVTTTSQLQVYDYADQPHHSFATPHQTRFHYAGEAVSHTRNLTFLKKRMDGPYFDLEDLWDEHTYYEFGNRSVENCMNTMVQEPYVNHIPTMTGGIGRKDLTEFYTNHFIFSNPSDAELELISRTVGVDRVVDEFVYKCTHDQQIDWLIPGVPPSGIKLEVPMLAIVNIRGDRLYHEHIHWDQGTVLRQLGVLPEYLPFQPAENNLKAPNGVHGSKLNGHQRLEIQVPVGGTETVAKLRDKGSVPSNQMFDFQTRES